MPRRRLFSLSVVALLATTITLAFLAPPMAQQQPITGSATDPDDLLAAVLPEHREAAAEQVATMPRYTIAASFILPAPDVEEQPVPATPIASPQASPTAASPIASPQASPVASPQATPVVTAIAESGETDSQATRPEPDAPADAQPRIVGTLDLHYVNTTGEALDELYVRLYPNLRQYGSGRMVIANVQVDGEPVEVLAPSLHSVPDATPIPIENAGARDLAIVRIPLGGSLAAGESASVRMDFSSTVPIDPPDENGLFQYTPETGTWTLAHWFPMLAGYDPESGWEVDPPAAWSDITFSNTALFDISLTAPDDLIVVTTGIEVESDEGEDYRTARIITGPVRDVAIVAEPNLLSSSTEVGETTITSWYRPGEEAGGETILQWAAQSFEIFTELFGPYPYTTLDIAPVPEVIGYEFPQFVFIGNAFYPDPETLGSRPGAIEFLVAHEVAHQWWYGLVGSNPHRHAYLDEGLTEYSTILYFEHQYGDEVAASYLRDGLMHRYALMLASSGDQIVDQATAAFPDVGTYYATVYRKAGLGFEAIREEIGDEAFFDALQAYAEAYQYSVAAPDDLLAAFEDASGQDLAEIWTLWFESDRGRIEIVMEPLPETPPPATPEASPAPVASPAEVTASPVTTAPASPVASPVAPDASPIVTRTATPMASPIVGTPAASPVVAD